MSRQSEAEKRVQERLKNQKKEQSKPQSSVNRRGRRLPTDTKPKEGAVTTKEGNKFIYLQGKWYRPSEIPSELKGSKTVKKALGRPAAKPAPAKPATSKSTASKAAASKPAPKPASKPAPAKPAPAKTTASKPASAPKSDKKRKSIAKTLEQLQRMKRRSKKRQEGKEPKMQGVGPYRSAKKYSAKMAGQPAKPAQAAKPNTKSKLRQAMEERMKKQRGRGY